MTTLLPNIQNEMRDIKAKLAIIDAKLDATLKNPSSAPFSVPPARTECLVPSPITSMAEFDGFEEASWTPNTGSRRYEFSLF
ncbi:unnamed protein product [Dibothriocephalus latus]|uniref:Uncharacterized protein n=1 Tax=Dibothriocephalus latus TaxID=60516 RepID=A0A3P7NLF5_DIBLA|nr:unnamed protein product [Dibothriocephalus latus]